MLYFFEQFLNGIQLGMLLFLLAAGLTLIFGIMDLVNLAHGSLYMLGAYFAATFVDWTDSFLLGAVLALAATAAVGMIIWRTDPSTCLAPISRQLLWNGPIASYSGQCLRSPRPLRSA
jgi:branched-subunit amino acid ABC-type transport system permease component